MAKTRAASGIHKPNVPYVPTSAPASRQTAGTTKATKTKAKAAAGKAKAKAKKPAEANTSQPRAKKEKVATGRVGKAPAAGASKAKTVKKATGAGRPKKDKVAEKDEEDGEKGDEGEKVEKAGAKGNKREVSLLDKVQGVAEKIVGVLEGKPGKKAAGTRKIRGTDGKGATRGPKKA